jgi:hypothetical protein
MGIYTQSDTVYWAENPAGFPARTWVQKVSCESQSVRSAATHTAQFVAPGRRRCARITKSPKTDSDPLVV